MSEFYQQIMTYCDEFGKQSGIVRAWIGYHAVVLTTKADTSEVS